MESSSPINNECYHSMGDLWYQADDHPIALLRQESLTKNAWIFDEIKSRGLESTDTKILDIGCGAGFFCNLAAQKKFQVSGVDLSDDALQVAGKFDSTKTANYVKSDARKTPFADASFDIVVSLDFLEHIDQPHLVIKEASRVLRPGGLFFFHTFSRNFLSYLVVIKGVEWFVKNTPQNLHTYPLFINPNELDFMCSSEGIQTLKWTGLRPVINGAFFKMLTTGRVSHQFRFKKSSYLGLSYLGVGQRSLT